MSYIGKEPQVGAYHMLDSLTASATADYTLQLDSVNFVPESANHLIVSLNGVIQKAGSSFTVSGSTLSFSSALTSSDSIDFVLSLGNVLDIGTPSDGTVTNAKTNFVSTSSAAGLQIKGDGTTDGTLQLNCSQNSHGIKLKSPAHSAAASYTLTFPTTDGNADEFLQTNGSGTLTWSSAGGITEADQFRLTAQLQANADPISSNLERVDDATFSKIGTGMSLSSGVYTFPSTGLYLVGCHAEFQISQDLGAEVQTFVSSDSGSNYDIVAVAMGGKQGSNFTHFTSYSSTYVNVTNASTFRVKFKADGFYSSDTRLRGDTGYNMTSFVFIRLGDSQ